jgi:murein endopeptidase
VRLALALILIVLALPAVLLASTRDGDPAEPPPVQTLPPVATETPAPLPPIETPTAMEPLPRSRAAGEPWAGRLLRGRPLPREGRGYLTWDPILKHIPNRRWRLWGTDRLLRTVRRVLATYSRRNPAAQPVLVGDLSRPRGGDFGPRYGGIGHASHQNGLDADIYYPRLDGELRSPATPDLVDRAAAQELVDLFVAAGAERVFVGPSLGLRGPRDVVSPLTHHDNHLHVRLRGRR